MNRLEVISLFKALQIMGRKKDLDGIMELVDTILEESLSKPSLSAKRGETYGAEK